MPKTIRDRFYSADAERREALDTARRCAAQTIPHILPPEDHAKYTQLPEKWHSLGSRGITNMAGRILTGVYPEGVPWAQLIVPPEIEYGNVDPAALAEINQGLFKRILLILGAIEQGDRDYWLGSVQGFRTQKRKSLVQTLVTGDSLERINDDFSITVFRRDHYVNYIDSGGRAIWHVTREHVHPSTLTEEQREIAKVEPDQDIEVELYSLCEWQPSDKCWLYTQEINGTEVYRREEKISPLVWTPFDLVPGEHYGRGWVEQNLGDLETFNEVTGRILDWAELCSRAHPVKDPKSNITNEQLGRLRSGDIIEDNVSGGVPVHLGWLRVDKLNDLSFVGNFRDNLRLDLSRAMLLQTDSVRDSERTTAFEVQEVVIRELEGSLGGFYAPIADRQQIPTLHRVNYMLERSKIIQPIELDGKPLAFRTLTGIAALSAARQFATLQQFVGSVAQIVPTLPIEIDRRTLIDVMARYARIYVPNLIKSKAQVEAEVQQMMAQQLQAQAGQQAVQTVGSIAEQAAANSGG